MTKVYSVAVTEVSYGFVDVTASSETEALEKAEEEYYNGNVCWNNSDFNTEIK